MSSLCLLLSAGQRDAAVQQEADGGSGLRARPGHRGFPRQQLPVGGLDSAEGLRQAAPQRNHTQTYSSTLLLSSTYCPVSSQLSGDPETGLVLGTKGFSYVE